MVAVYQTVSTKPESATKDVYSLNSRNTKHDRSPV